MSRKLSQNEREFLVHRSKRLQIVLQNKPLKSWKKRRQNYEKIRKLQRKKKELQLPIHPTGVDSATAVVLVPKKKRKPPKSYDMFMDDITTNTFFVD